MKNKLSSENKNLDGNIKFLHLKMQAKQSYNSTLFQETKHILTSKRVEGLHFKVSDSL